MERDRRQFERIESLVGIRYASGTSQISGYSLTKDVSAGGVGLPVDGKIPEGEELNIVIVLGEGGQATISAKAKVAWSKRNFEHWKSRYSSGLRFVDIKPSEKDKVVDYAKNHRWIKSDFERSLEENKIPVLGRRGRFEI